MDYEQRKARIERFAREAQKTMQESIAKSNTVAMEGMCLECEHGKYLFQVPNTVVEKYAGTLREIMSEKPCPCGSHLWLISIPPKQTAIDDMMD